VEKAVQLRQMEKKQHKSRKVFFFWRGHKLNYKAYGAVVERRNTKEGNTKTKALLGSVGQTQEKSDQKTRKRKREKSEAQMQL